MIIKPGDVYWIRLVDDKNLRSDIPHPHVVIQPVDPQKIVVCAVTTNAKKISIPGNMLLEIGEANLPKQSIVEVSKVMMIDAAQLGEYIGTLSEQRMKQLWAGIFFVQTSFFNR